MLLLGPLTAALGLLRRLAAADRGNAAVEMGFLVSIVLLLMSAALAFGMIIFQFMEVNNAVEAGVAYAVSHVAPVNFSTSGTSIPTVVQGATALSVTGRTATSFWGCASSSGIADQAPTCSHTATTCGVTCASGYPPGYYVTVPAQYHVIGNSILSLRGLNLTASHSILPDPLSLQTTVRVQ